MHMLYPLLGFENIRTVDSERERLFGAKVRSFEGGFRVQHKRKGCFS